MTLLFFTQTKVKMSLTLIPENKKAGEIEFPLGFWPALCVETPLSKVFGTWYTRKDKLMIHYEHEGYVGGLIGKGDCDTMQDLLNEFVATDDYKNHEYFGERKNQMESFLEWLPTCGGFRML